MEDKLGFKKYLKGDKKNFTKDAKKLEKKTPNNQYMGSGSKFPAAYRGVHENMLNELLGGNISGVFSANVNSATAVHAPYNNDETEEEQEQTANKIDLARQLFQALINRPDATRKGIIQQFVEKIGVTNSTAVSYYERLAKEAGLTGKDDDKQDIGSGGGFGDEEGGTGPVDELPADTDMDLDDDVGDPVDLNRAGIIRTVDNAHLIYKRRDEEGKFEELWVYNTNGKLGDELDIRRDILAGTDIEPKKTQSPDGSQKYTLTTLGNAQFVHVTGLPN